MPLTIAAILAYNEENSIAKMVLGCKEHVDRMIVIDEGSSDATAEIASALGAEVVQHGMNRGYGAALRSCFEAARQMSADRIVIIGPGGKHNHSEIPELLAGLQEGNDAVFQDAEPLSCSGAYGRRAIEAIQITSDDGSAGSDIRAQIQHMKVATLQTGRATGGEPHYRGKRIAVVVPAYNEEKLIGETLGGIPDYVARVYAVNDGSSDHTGEIIEDYARRDSRIVPIHHNPNRGVGAAITSGYKRAVKDGMDIAAVMAGDNQMDPAQLPSLLDPIVEGRANYTKGNRLISEAFRTGMSRWRSFGNSILTFLTKVASGYWQMMDPQNGYTAISTKALAELPLDDIYQGYGYCNNLLVWLNIHGMRVQDVAIPARYGEEKSKIRYSTYIPRVSKLLLFNFLFRLKTKYIHMGFHPLAFFYLAGAVLVLLGLLGGAITLWEKFVMGYALLFVHGVLSFLMFTIGMQFLLFAMIFDMHACAELSH